MTAKTPPSIPTIPFSPYRYRRRKTRVVPVGKVLVGGDQPIRIQSMTTTLTTDTAATVAQAIRMIQTGCEIVRVTAPAPADARNLKNIREALSKQGFSNIPLVADIHFNPDCAMEAADHVEKIRINPGNYADSKAFKQISYTDNDYDKELARIEERFTPLLLKLKKLKRALRIGTNHGSLSDRILNRYGDTPEGMVESALEFVRVCRKHDFHDLVLSMKASNVKIVIAAYRLLAARMAEEGMDYPFHLGVTEAGEGEDGRIKSAIGIGALLADGIGDTIRVSLSENPELEMPVAKLIAQPYQGQGLSLPAGQAGDKGQGTEAQPSPLLPLPFSLNPFSYSRRPSRVIQAGPVAIGGSHPIRVVWEAPQVHPGLLSEQLRQMFINAGDTAPEIIRWKVESPAQLETLAQCQSLRLPGAQAPAWFADFRGSLDLALQGLSAADIVSFTPSLDLPHEERVQALRTFFKTAGGAKKTVWIENPIVQDDCPAGALSILMKRFDLAEAEGVRDILLSVVHPDFRRQICETRELAAELQKRNANPPIHLRALPAGEPDVYALNASTLLGSLLCDGIGDSVQAGLGTDGGQDLRLSYSILQNSGARITRTEFISCPSCGRTLFDLQETIALIKARTSHLKGVKIAIMGCIVNGPGEMADADFGYVGGAPGKINLYVGKTCLEKNIPSDVAVEKLVELIKQHGRWTEPPSR